MYELKEQPDCFNSKCNNKAMILIGRRAFCGSCAAVICKKIEEKEIEKEDILIQEIFRGYDDNTEKRC